MLASVVNNESLSRVSLVKEYRLIVSTQYVILGDWTAHPVPGYELMTAERKEHSPEYEQSLAVQVDARGRVRSAR